MKTLKNNNDVYFVNSCNVLRNRLNPKFSYKLEDIIINFYGEKQEVITTKAGALVLLKQQGMLTINYFTNNGVKVLLYSGECQNPTVPNAIKDEYVSMRDTGVLISLEHNNGITDYIYRFYNFCDTIKEDSYYKLKKRVLKKEETITENTIVNGVKTNRINNATSNRPFYNYIYSDNNNNDIDKTL